MVDISVWITTYNHELFIAQAIESVLMQQTTFTYELVIGEDCSTDRTRDIVLNYKAKYPEKISLFLPEKNIGMIPMAWATYKFCTGRYVAWLDGDDYWLDPHKLQKQVSFLENNPAFSFCFHKVKLQVEYNLYISRDPLMERDDDTLSFRDFIRINNPVHALSVVHRNILSEYLPSWVFSLPYPDLGLYFVFCGYGEAKFMRDVMGTYRIHDNGAYSGESRYHNLNKALFFFKLIKKVISKEYVPDVNRMIKYHRRELIKVMVDNSKMLRALRAVKREILHTLKPVFK